MSYSNEIDSNNKDLQTILETINNLPEAGGSSGPCSWNDITDKPFGEVTPEPIVWDGVIGDGYLVDLGVGGFRFYRISEGYISKDDAYGGQFKVIATDNGRVDLDDPINDEWAKNGSEYGFTDPNTWYIDGLGLPMFLVVNTKETIVESFTGENIELTFEPGIYVFKSNNQHLSSVVFPEHIKKIDEKYLPESVAKTHLITITTDNVTIEGYALIYHTSTEHVNEFVEAFKMGEVIMFDISVATECPGYLRPVSMVLDEDTGLWHFESINPLGDGTVSVILTDLPKEE